MMASDPRHMRYVPAASDAYADVTTRRGATTRRRARRGVAASDEWPLDGTVATDRAGEAQPWVTPATDGNTILRRAVPSRPYDAHAVPAAHTRDARSTRLPVQGVAAAMLLAVALVLRLAAVALCVLVLANATASGFMRLAVVDATAAVTRALPSAIAGVHVMPTVLGGTFRSDLAIFAIILFAVDWACVRGAWAVRGR